MATTRRHLPTALEFLLLVITVALCGFSLVLAALGGEVWLVAVLAVAAAPIVVAWHLDRRPHGHSVGRHRRGAR